MSPFFAFAFHENARERSEIHIFCASAVKRLQDQDAQLPQVCVLCVKRDVFLDAVDVVEKF